jgi:hypothetical protein
MNAARIDWSRERNIASAREGCGHWRAENVDVAGPHVAQRRVSRYRHPVDREFRKCELVLGLLGDHLTELDGVTLGRARPRAMSEGPRIGDVAELDVPALLDALQCLRREGIGDTEGEREHHG